MSVALYLDRTSEPIEQLLMTFPVRGVEFKFLNPISGPQGTLEEADYYAYASMVITLTTAVSLVAIPLYSIFIEYAPTWVWI